MSKSFIKFMMWVLLLAFAFLTLALVSNRFYAGEPPYIESSRFSTLFIKGAFATSLKVASSLITVALLRVVVGFYVKNNAKANLVTLLTVPIVVFVGFMLSFFLWWEF